ncbi:MAG TPA: PAS domain S-box protein [Burkholderiales bacterium]|nr:PAS domain S-box protein [Burkholderiales bacterium]
MIWMNRTISLARDGSGKPKYFIRIFEDITERKQIETEHAQLAAIVETSNDAIISRGLDRTILTWNPAAEILFGWTAQEAVGRSILLIVPPERHNENAHRRELVHQGLPVPAYDTQRLTRDGRRIDVALSQSAIRNKRGEVIAISLVFHDITQRKELERRFELMFSHAAVGMSLGSLDGRFLQVNRKYADMLGYSREELAGMPLASVVHPEDRTEGELLRQKLLDEGVEGISAERRYIRKDGGTIWASRTLSLARNAAGEPLYYISVVEDITERRELERRFELTFNQAAVGILHTGLDGRYLRVNRKLCDITGYTEEELTGEPRLALSHPDDIESGGAKRTRLLAGEIASHSNEKRYVRKDGSVIWVNRTESLARDDAGGPLYFIRVIEDITARKEMEQQFRDTFEQAAVGIVHVDFDNRYIRVNRKFHEITGYAEGDLIGRSSSTISHPEDVGSGDRERRRLHAGEIPSYSNEKRYLHKKNGAAIWVKRTESIARDGTGNPLYYIRVVEDITEHKEMERRFELTFNHAAVGMTQTGLDYRFLQVNRKFEEMLGYSREELAGLTAMDITHPDDRAETLSSREKLLKGEIESASSEKRLIRKDGRVIWANRTFSIARGATGEPICFITVVEDITERKDFERRYRETFDQAAVGIVHTSADGRYLRVNQKFCDMLGYDEAELVGRVAADFTYPEDRDKGAENRRLLWEGRLDHLVEERRYLRKDGRVVWTNRTVSLARDAAGAPMYFIRVIENITDRKEAEERYRATFDNAPVGIMHTALDNYRILRANHKLCEMLGYAQEELLEKTSTDIVHPDFRFSDRSSYMDQLLEGKVQSFASERVFVRKDGAPLWVNRTVSLVRDASGNPQYFIRVIEDISERKRAEAALRESEEQFRQLANNIPQVFWITDVGHRETIYISPAAAVLTGRPVQQLCASPREMIRAAHPEDRRRVYEARKAAAAGGYDQTYRVVRPDGTTRWVNDRAFAVTDEAGNVYRIAGITEDVTERTLAEERLTQLAHYDVLTDLPNRVLFYDRLRQVLAQAKRSQWIVGVMFVDLDRFKNVNDTLGHAVGDLLLRQVSERLSRAVRSGDTVGRLGGDEFAIVLSNLSSAQDASLVAQKLMASFNEPFKLQGADFYVTASIGITLYPDDAEEQDTLIKNADAAMYRAKDIGRNTYQFYRSEMNARALELLSMESHMRRALDRDEFLLHYQPKASLRDGTIVGVEALLRWQHPERGLMAPAAFMSVLEETGLIVRVGERVLNAVCRQIKAWQGAGIKVVPVAINLSAREFAAKDLAGTITRILREHDVDPALIELEITEGSLMVNTEEVVGTLEALGRLGIGLSIDDFGTGYSSLSYLKRFSLDAVKIDRSFVRDITTDADDANITRAIISMAHSLGLKVIAEGVETEAQAAFLADYGCDQIQGYYLTPPLAADDYVAWLVRRGAPKGLLAADDLRPAVLLVDDEEIALVLGKRALGKDGYQVHTANNAHEAFKLLSQHRIDVVVSDHHMPGISGIEFLVKVKTLFPDTVRMMLSGIPDIRIAAEAVSRAEVFRFLPKGVSDDRLRAEVGNALRSRAGSGLVGTAGAPKESAGG